MSRFDGLTARERYLKEYRENRVHVSYLETEYDFEGDPARRNGYRSWVMRETQSFDETPDSVFRAFGIEPLQPAQPTAR